MFAHFPHQTGADTSDSALAPISDYWAAKKVYKSRTRVQNYNPLDFPKLWLLLTGGRFSKLVVIYGLILQGSTYM
jgi:hypothetical protein